MGHKVHPIGFRVGIIRPWQARWYADRGYKDRLQEDLRLRAYILKRHANAGIAEIDIDRDSANRVTLTIHTAKPGIIIGRSGTNVEELRRQLEKQTGKKVQVNIREVTKPELDSQLVAEGIAEQLLKRASFPSVEALQVRVLAFIKYFNATMAKPFKWTYGQKPLCV